MKNNRRDSANCNNVHNATAHNRKRCAAPTNKRLHKKHKNCSLNSLTPAVGSIVSFPCITRFMPSRPHFVQQLICKPSRCFFKEQHTVGSTQPHCHYHSKSSATNKMCIARQGRSANHKHMEHATQHSTAALIGLVKEYENIVHKVQVSELRELLAPLKETALRLNKLARASQLEEPCHCRCRYKPDFRNISLDFSDVDCNGYSEGNKFKDTWLCNCLPNQLNISRNDQNLHMRDNEEDVNLKKTKYCECHTFDAVTSTYGGVIYPVEMLDSEAAQTLCQERDTNQEIVSSAINNEICPMCGKQFQGDETVKDKVDVNIEEKKRDGPDIPGIVLSSLDDCPNNIEGKDSCDDCGCLTLTDDRMEKSTTAAQPGDNVNQLEHNQQALRRYKDASTSIDENYRDAATDPVYGLCGAIFNANPNIRTECQQTSIISNSATILDDKFSMSVTANLVETITSGDNIIRTQQHITVLASNLQERTISSTDEYTDEYTSASDTSLLQETQKRSTSCNWDCVAVCKESVSCENLKTELSEDDLGKLCTCGCGYYQGEIDEICSCNCADSVNSEINECDPIICSPTKNFNGDDGTNRSFDVNKNMSKLQETIDIIKKENDYLTKLMKRCKCVEDDVKNLSESPPIRYTYSGLLAAVEVLKSKCRSKDEMITVLAEGLRGSQNIDQIAKNLTESCSKYSSMDFDHRGLYAYLCATKSNEQENIIEYGITTDEDDSNFAIPAPTEFTIVRDICNCFLVSWKMEDKSKVKGYQIFINGQIDTHVRTSTRTEAVLGFHDTTKPIELTLYAVGKGDRLSDPVKLTYSKTCNYIE